MKSDVSQVFNGEATFCRHSTDRRPFALISDLCKENILNRSFIEKMPFTNHLQSVENILYIFSVEILLEVLQVLYSQGKASRSSIAK